MLPIVSVRRAAPAARLLLPWLAATALSACGGEPVDAGAESSEALTLKSADGRLEVKDKPTRRAGRVVFGLKLAGEGGAIAASVGAEELELTRTRTGRTSVTLDSAALAAAFGGAQVHLLGEATGEARAFGTFDVSADVKGRRGTLTVADVRVTPVSLRISLEAKKPVERVAPVEGAATLDADDPKSVEWTLPLEVAAELAVAAKRVSVVAYVAGKRTSTSFSIGVLASSPHVRAVPADFDLAFAPLAEAPERKISATALPADLPLLAAVAAAIGEDETAALNVERLYVSREAPAGLTIVQGHGSIGRDESWWLKRDELQRRLERALRSLPFHLRQDGAPSDG